MWSEMAYFYQSFNNYVIWNGLLLSVIQQSCDLKWVNLHVGWGGLFDRVLYSFKHDQISERNTIITPVYREQTDFI